MPLCRQVGLDPNDIVLDGTQVPLPNRDRAPNFLAHVYCAQTAGCIKMPLGMEVGLDSSDIVLDEDPAPLLKKRGGQSPQFSAHFCCGQTAVWIKM